MTGTGSSRSDLDFAALADPRATTVVYMGRRTAAALAAKIIARGLGPDTPALVVSNVSRDDSAASRPRSAGWRPARPPRTTPRPR